MSNSRYTRGENAILYSSIVGGAVTPIAFARYAFMPESNSVGQEVAYWGLATLLNLIPLSRDPPIPAAGFGAGFGAAVGTATRTILRYERIKRKRLENIVVEAKDN